MYFGEFGSGNTLVDTLTGNPSIQLCQFAAQRLDLTCATTLFVAIIAKTEETFLLYELRDVVGIRHNDFDG